MLVAAQDPYLPPVAVVAVVVAAEEASYLGKVLESLEIFVALEAASAFALEAASSAVVDRAVEVYAVVAAVVVGLVGAAFDDFEG